MPQVNLTWWLQHKWCIANHINLMIPTSHQLRMSSHSGMLIQFSKKPWKFWHDNFRPIGGLGTSFSAGAARRLSIVSEHELVIDDVSGFTYDKKYKRKYQLDNFNISSRRQRQQNGWSPFQVRLCKKKISAITNLSKRSYIKQHRNDLSKTLTLRPKTIYLEGYWQSEDYFIDVTSQSEDLQIVSPTGEETKKMANTSTLQDPLPFMWGFWWSASRQIQLSAITTFSKVLPESSSGNGNTRSPRPLLCFPDQPSMPHPSYH